MKLLSFDTSTATCSVCLSDGEVVLSNEYLVKHREQGQLLLPMIHVALQNANLSLQDLDALAITSGPGSFVGLRIAFGVAQGIGFVTNLPIIPISTLAVIAQSAFRLYQITRCCVALDAHQDEVYVGHYSIENGLAVAISPDQLLPGELLKRENDVVVGNAWMKYEVKSHADLTYPHAEDLRLLALANRNHATSIELLEPLYLRGTEAWRSQDKPNQ